MTQGVTAGSICPDLQLQRVTQRGLTPRRPFSRGRRVHASLRHPFSAGQSPSEAETHAASNKQQRRPRCSPLMERGKAAVTSAGHGNGRLMGGLSGRWLFICRVPSGRRVTVPPTTLSLVARKREIQCQVTSFFRGGGEGEEGIEMGWRREVDGIKGSISVL